MIKTLARCIVLVVAICASPLSAQTLFSVFPEFSGLPFGQADCTPPTS